MLPTVSVMPPPSPSAPWCYVYFIQSGDAIKIGKSSDPKKRLKDLQTSHPHALSLLVAVPTHQDFERAVHTVFKHLCRTGEWFAANHELVEFIRRLQTGENPITLLWETMAIVASTLEGTPLSALQRKQRRRELTSWRRPPAPTTETAESDESTLAHGTFSGTPSA